MIKYIMRIIYVYGFLINNSLCPYTNCTKMSRTKASAKVSMYTGKNMQQSKEIYTDTS